MDLKKSTTTKAIKHIKRYGEICLIDKKYFEGEIIHLDGIDFFVDAIERYRKNFNAQPDIILIHPNTFAAIRMLGTYYYDEATAREIITEGIHGAFCIDKSPVIKVSSRCEQDAFYLFNNGATGFTYSKEVKKSLLEQSE